MQKQIAFFKEAVKNIKMSGSIMPSSRFLIKKMLSKIDFSKDLILVEYGPANGIITHEIIKKMSKNSKLICFELNPIFYQELLKNITDDRVIVINESAENIIKTLDKLNIKSINYCVSSLPLAMIPFPICSKIIKNTLKVLKPKGGFIQYQYSLQFYKHFKNMFHKENIHLNFCLMNFPPAFVYNCKKK